MGLTHLDAGIIKVQLQHFLSMDTFMAYLRLISPSPLFALYEIGSFGH